MARKSRVRTSQPTQPHGSSQPTHLPRASQPSNSHSYSQPQAEEYLDDEGVDVQAYWGQLYRRTKNPKQSHEDENEDLITECEVSIEDESGVRNKRGITRLTDVWNLPNTQRIAVRFNQLFVPVGDEGGLLNRFIGTIARKAHLCPINCKTWHAVPQHYKEACWNMIQSKFKIPENNLAREAVKHNALKLLGMRLRDWRCTLKAKYFDEAKTAAQIVATAPPMVNPEHYADLVSYWFSNEGKALSLKNKREKGERDKNENVHTAGSKSFARLADEMETNLKFAPSRAMVYIRTYTTGSDDQIVPVNGTAAANIAAIEDLMLSQPNDLESNCKGSIFWSPDDVYSQAIPKKEWHGRVRGCGFGPTPKRWGSTCSDSPRFNAVDVEERKRDKETVRILEDKRLKLATSKNNWPS